MVAVEAHCPSAGVKVYVVVLAAAVLIAAGIHLPVIPFVEVEGKAGGAEFRQNGPISLNVGVIEFEITISIVAAEAH